MAVIRSNECVCVYRSDGIVHFLRMRGSTISASLLSRSIAGIKSMRLVSCGQVDDLAATDVSSCTDCTDVQMCTGPLPFVLSLTVSGCTHGSRCYQHQQCYKCTPIALVVGLGARKLSKPWTRRTTHLTWADACAGVIGLKYT